MISTGSSRRRTNRQISRGIRGSWYMRLNKLTFFYLIMTLSDVHLNIRAVMQKFPTTKRIMDKLSKSKITRFTPDAVVACRNYKRTAACSSRTP